MNFIEMVNLLERGHKCKRLDWGYPETAFITLEEHNGEFHFYMTGEYYTSNQVCGYGITYQDITSNKWEKYETKEQREFCEEVNIDRGDWKRTDPIKGNSSKNNKRNDSS